MLKWNKNKFNMKKGEVIFVQTTRHAYVGKVIQCQKKFVELERVTKIIHFCEHEFWNDFNYLERAIQGSIYAFQVPNVTLYFKQISSITHCSHKLPERNKSK